MIEVIMTKGLPASGKSTWAKNHVKNSKGKWKRINRDELRLMIDAGEWTPSNEKFIIATRNSILLNAVREGINVIIDDTNLASKNWNDVVKILETTGLEIKLYEKCFPIDVEVAIERDLTRGAASVGAEVIKGMWDKNLKYNPNALEPKTQMFYQKESLTLSQDENLPSAFICDLDGTLAIMGNRSPYDASFCDRVDKPNPPVVEVVKRMWLAGHKIIFVSGREEKDRDPTVRFIAKTFEGFHDFGYVLLMRATDDQRKDTIVKKEIFYQSIYDKYNVMFAIDDRPSVVRMWRYEIGLPVFQVNDKEF